MLTLRSRMYTREELLALAAALRKAEEYFSAQCRTSLVTCKSCRFRHACYDLAQVREHAVKEAYTFNERK